jgi:hypothetical protein
VNGLSWGGALVAAKHDKTGSFHEDLQREDKFQGSSNRSFGLVLAAFFFIISGVKFWGGRPTWAWWLVPAVALLIIAQLRPGLLAPFNWLWTMLGLFLFRIVSPAVLGVIYYGMITPMGLLMRARKKDILKRHLDRSATTYWIARDPPGPEPETMKNQF